MKIVTDAKNNNYLNIEQICRDLFRKCEYWIIFRAYLQSIVCLACEIDIMPKLPLCDGLNELLIPLGPGLKHYIY